ncbi:MAG TPA: hypothetical protein VHO70_17010 [Chitinispirillaceae bacterium]|nr:hypothetical protein [Chitinispirillaceae bacterium]
MKKTDRFFITILKVTIVVIILTGFQVTAVHSQDTSTSSGETGENQAYKIEKPGTITFTVGVKIKGKVEKPQVMIFLPKEKPIYTEHTLERSFASELAEPLDFSPIIE